MSLTDSKMNISHRFRRLSVVAAIAGSMVIEWLWAVEASTAFIFAAAIVLLIFTSALFALALLWTVDSFEKSD
jgi:hypothetical protein